MLGQNLKQLYESLGPRECVSKLRKLLKEKKVTPQDFSIRELAESFCGHDWVARLNPRNIERYGGMTKDVTEAGEGVDVSAFSNITGQIVYSSVHQGWEQVERIADGLMTRVPTDFSGEKVPGIGMISGDGELIHPGKPYPELGFGEQYWTTPSTDKHGMIVSVEKETIYFDRTSLITKRANQAGERLAYNKERRCLACIAGITLQIGNEAFNGQNHVWLGDSFSTYSTTDQTGSTSGKVIQLNAKGSNELLDWTDIEALWLLFTDMRDPDTGLPININPDTLVVMPYKFATASRIASATEVRSGDITTGAGTQTITGNPITMNGLVRNVIQSKLLYKSIVDSGVSAANAKDWYFYGDFKKAFEYRENWPLTVVQAPANSTAEFERDIVLRVKASERGVPWCADPRYVVKSYVS